MDKQTLSDITAQADLMIYFGLDQTIITQGTRWRFNIVVKIDETKANRYRIKNPAVVSPALKNAIANYACTPLADRLNFTTAVPQST